LGEEHHLRFEVLYIWQGVVPGDHRFLAAGERRVIKRLSLSEGELRFLPD
jgi:hypothetical protein